MTQTKTLYIDKLRGNCYEKKMPLSIKCAWSVRETERGFEVHDSIVTSIHLI